MNNQMISLLDGMLEADQELLFSHLENEKQKDEKHTPGNFEQVRLALCGRKVKMVTTKLAHQNACRHVR